MVKKIAIKNSHTPELHKANIIKPVALTEEIEVVLHLRRDPSGKDLPDLQTLSAASPLIQKRIRRKDFESPQGFGASSEDVEKVKAFARDSGLTVTRINPVHRTVALKGRVSSINEAFNVTLEHFRLGEKMFRGHREEIHIPEDLKGIVNAVLGLDDSPAVRPYFHLAKSRAKSSRELAQDGKFFPGEVAKLYNFPVDARGQGESVAILELDGGYEREYVKQYFENVLKIPMPNIADVLINDGKNAPKDSSGAYSSANPEVYLDIEVLGAIANQADIYVYFCPNTLKDFLESLKQAIHDPDRDHSLISISWGKPESLWNRSTLDAFNETLHEAAALGISVCAAAGDLGSSDTIWNIEQEANVDFPASSPYCLGCGGTTLKAEEDRIRSEVVWNSMSGATGGGVSQVFQCPDYQSGAGIHPKSVKPEGKTGRGVPDVAGNADSDTGYIVQINDELKASGGTSAVAPLYGALVLQINEKLNTRVGFITPFLYSLKGASGVFHDITQGNNSFAGIDGYEATPGWDPCTGWGSVHGTGLLDAIKKS